MRRVELTNICFHGIGHPRRDLEPGEGRYWVEPDLYHRVLDEIAETPDVRVSFDDGNVSDVEIALEGLLQRGLRATFFVLAGRVGRSGSLDRGGIVELCRQGMVVGTHGMDHRSWRGLPPDGRDRELVQARRQIEELTGSPVDLAALPLGQYDRALLSHLKREGYAAVHTSDRRPAREGAWIQPRYSVRQDDTLESVRSAVLAGPGARRRLRLELAGLAKRIR